MPKDLALEALDWFAVRGGAPPDATIVERYRAAVSARAGALEAAGRIGEALRAWEGLAEDLAGTPAAVAAAGQAERLGEPARRDLKRVRKQVASDLAWIEDANDRIAALAREEMPALPRLLREFDVDGLRKQASSADAVRAHSAARRLSLVATNASFYIPELLKERGQLASAARWYDLAIAIDPDAPGPHLGLARVLARAGNRKGALDALRAASARGLRLPRKRLAEDPELALLAGDPAFMEILESLPSS
jgi:tetratricopeptide (TPR) repeat protein